MTKEQRKIVSLILSSIAVGFNSAAERILEEGNQING